MPSYQETAVEIELKIEKFQKTRVINRFMIYNFIYTISCELLSKKAMQ